MKTTAAGRPAAAERRDGHFKRIVLLLQRLAGESLVGCTQNGSTDRSVKTSGCVKFYKNWEGEWPG